ncbi:retrovirus-related pol polyprotein from transposon TNT 1-94, partial [Tanacetum coccineum]
MSTTDKESIAPGTDNRSPMLEESDFDSWKIRIQRYIRGKPREVIRKKRDDEFTEAENIKELADIQAINILSQGLPRHIFNTLNQTETAQEIWENVELLMQGSGLTEQQQKEILFDQYERFRANGNESIHDYFVRFHKLINDMKITKIQILAHQRNTKFLNNLPSYWSKYVTIVKNSQDISNVSYVNLYTHLKSYEQHAMKTLSKMNQSSGNTDPLAYMAQATKTSSHTSSQQYSPSVPPQSPQSTNDAMLATMNQIVNLLSGFQKQFPPTNNQLRTSTNPMTQATIQAGQITTESVQRRAPGNKGKQIATGSQGKLVTCYNCRGQGHIARECKEKKREKDSQWFKDKALLMEAKEKGAILDAYDYDVDEAPHAAAAFMANLTGTSTREGTSNDTDFHSEVIHIVLWYVDSGCLRHMTGDHSNLINYVQKFIGTVRFGNDQFAVIVGYGDYKIGDTIITRVYYVEGLSHNLFSVGQFCDGDLEVAFRKNTCFIRNKDKVDLLKGSRTTNLYSISLKDMLEASLVCLLSKASSTKSWLWHRRLNHLNFGTLNELARKDLVRGLPKLKYEKEHLCPSCQLGKSKKSSHPLKTVNTNTEILNTLHMDLCGPMRVESINGKKYILVVVDDYTRFGWVRFLRTKDETPEVIKKFIILTQRALNATVRYLRTDNGTEFVNKTLDGWFESVGISHETSVPLSPQQNGVVETRNRTLMESARTMFIFAKAPLFLWAEAVATACYTLNRSLVHTLHGKTYYELLKGKKPNLQYFRVFGSLCYPTNDYDCNTPKMGRSGIRIRGMLLQDQQHKI